MWSVKAYTGEIEGNQKETTMYQEKTKKRREAHSKHPPRNIQTLHIHVPAIFLVHFCRDVITWWRRWWVDMMIEVHCDIGVVASSCNKFGSSNANVTPRMKERPWLTFNEIRAVQHK